jgi:hypothetical protein
MTTSRITSLIVTTEPSARRDVRAGQSRSNGFLGGLKATREIVTPSFSLPVVRELPPRVTRSFATW